MSLYYFWTTAKHISTNMLCRNVNISKSLKYVLYKWQYAFSASASVCLFCSHISKTTHPWNFTKLSVRVIGGRGLVLPWQQCDKLCTPPFPSNRHHWSNGDCLEGKRENYQVCSVQYCVQQLYTVNCTHINRTNSSLDWVLSHWAHFTVLRIIFVYVLFCVWLYIACMCSIVTWWGGPGGIETWSLGPLLPSVLWHCWLGHLTRKNRSWYDLQV